MATGQPPYRCPRCGSRRLGVVVQCWADLLQDDPDNLQTDVDVSDQEWDEDSMMKCLTCHHGGKVRDFIDSLGDAARQGLAPAGLPVGLIECAHCGKAIAAGDGRYVNDKGERYITNQLDIPFPAFLCHDCIDVANTGVSDWLSRDSLERMARAHEDHLPGEPFEEEVAG